VSASTHVATTSVSVLADVAPAAGALLKTLADPTRRRVFLALMAGEICNCELSEALGLPQNLVSHHVRKLREAGLVEEHRDPHDGRWAHIEVDTAGLRAAWEALEAALHPSLVGERAPACRTPRARPMAQHRHQGETR
jgi:DNA-binding transcriptional ArsR family regulator